MKGEKLIMKWSKPTPGHRRRVKNWFRRGQNQLWITNEGWKTKGKNQLKSRTKGENQLSHRRRVKNEGKNQLKSLTKGENQPSHQRRMKINWVTDEGWKSTASPTKGKKWRVKNNRSHRQRVKIKYVTDDGWKSTKSPTKGENQLSILLTEGASHLSFLSSVFLFEPNIWWAPSCWGSDSAKQPREREEESSKGPSVECSNWLPS
jgi:hypothetical protein